MEPAAGLKEVEMFHWQSETMQDEDRAGLEQSSSPKADDAQRNEDGSGDLLLCRSSAMIEVLVGDRENAQELTCSICLDLFWDPLVIPSCRHAFCRNCVIKSMHSSPNGQQCPNCRDDILIDPLTHDQDETLQKIVEATMTEDSLARRKSNAIAELEDLTRLMVHVYPIFYMNPGCRPGQRIQLYLFEKR
eukprot:751264-Hanusia_phi.AAC.4